MKECKGQGPGRSLLFLSILAIVGAIVPMAGYATDGMNLEGYGVNTSHGPFNCQVMLSRLLSSGRGAGIAGGWTRAFPRTDQNW